MNWWSILEISRDSDLKTIKKAYARLLKIYNPEDDAEGYQRLREAYDIAVKYSKNNQKTREVMDYQENKIENEDSKNELITYYNEHCENKQLNFDISKNYHEKQNTKNNLNEQIEEFFYRLNEIYNDVPLRIDSTVWDDLLNSDVIWNVNSFPIIEEKIFDFLIEHKYLPPEIWTKLNNNFTWSKNERKLYNKYSEHIVDEFLRNLKEPNKLKYDFIRSINSEIADEYLFEREQAYEALKDKKYAKAYNHLKNANSLFSEDSELLRLMGNYNYEFKDIEKALEFYKSALEINNQDFNSAYNIGKILVTTEHFSEAISYFKLYLDYDSNDIWALNYIAYAYYYNDDFIMAKENFQKLLCFEVKSAIIKKYLKNIETQLKGKYVRKIKFDKENLILEEIVKREIKKINWTYIKYRANESIPGISKFVLRIIILWFVIFASRYNSEHKGRNDSNYKNSNKTYEDTNKESKNNVTELRFKYQNNKKILINLSNVKPIKYYKISEPFENKNIFSDSELDEKGLRDKVESQLYIGTSKENVIIFADSKCSDKTIDGNGKYKVHGIIIHINKEIIDKIKKEYASDYQNVTWIETGFIDASQATIDKYENK